MGGRGQNCERNKQCWIRSRINGELQKFIISTIQNDLKLAEIKDGSPEIRVLILKVANFYQSVIGFDTVQESTMKKFYSLRLLSDSEPALNLLFDCK